MKIFYKYYYIFLVTFVVIAILIGIYKGSQDVLLTIKNDKVIVRNEGDFEKEVEKVNEKASSIIVKKEEVNNTNSNTKNEGRKSENINNQKIQNKKVEESIDVSDENTASVFKVDKSEIANQYTSLEKLELLSILKIKLNEENYKTIENLLYSNEKDIDILKKINLVLKNNLDKKDYNKVLQLANRVINVDLVNR